VVVGGARTAIGDYGGALKDFAPTKLGAIAIKEAVSRAKVDPAAVGHVVMGSVIHGEARDMYLSRVAALDAGLPVGTPCLTVNRLCGSGLQAIVSAAQHILLGDTDTVVGGGAESMSRAAYFLPAGRWGQRMGDAAVVDAMTAALHDPFGHGHMGVTAENIAAKYGFTREQQDTFSLESHRRAANALEKGYFKSQIVPIEVKTRKGVEQYTLDEHVRPGAKMEDLAKLKTVFKKDGTVTAGNASGINDAGAAIVMMEAGAAAKKGVKALARGLRACRRRSAGDGPWADPGGEARLREIGTQARRHGRDRVERGFRRAGNGGDAGPRPRPREGEPQRRRSGARPPDRRHRRASHGEGAL
jgi:acetyl-CoA C-acetyltransferase